MTGIKLYKGLIDATKTIVATYGKDILTENRFVNILADMYPDRDNPAVFRIIRTLVNEGYCSDLLLCNKDSIQAFVTKSSLVLNQKNGYDKNLVDSILYSLAVGCCVISPQDINKPVSTPAPSKPNKPQKAPQQPPKPTQQPPNKKQKTHISFKEIGFILLALLGLLVGTVFICLYLNNVWWLFGSFFAIAILYGFTILQSLVYFENNGSNKSYGIVSAIVIMSVVINLSALFIDNIHSFMEYYSLYRPESYTFISVIFDFVICLCLISVLSLRKINIHDKDYKRGFWTTFIILVIIYQFVVFLPFYHRLYMKCRNSVVSYSRSSEIIDLSFQNVKIGDTVSEYTKLGFVNQGDSILSSFKESDNLSVKNHVYSEFVDSIYLNKSEWNNTPVNVYLYSFRDTIHAIHIIIDDIYSSPVSLVSIYESKYGKPEIEKNIMFKDNFMSDPKFYWQFKNGLIRIKSNSKGFLLYDNRYDSEILYVDNRFEELYQQKISLMKQKELKEEMLKMEREKKAKEEKRIKDSLEEIRKREQMKKDEIIRKKAIEQI